MTRPASGDRAPRMRPQIRASRGDTLLGKEHAHIHETMNRCARKVRTFDSRAYDPRAVEAARGVWRHRTIAEYRSTTVFAALAPQLMTARASLEAVSVVFRMAQDEIRHAEVCAETVVALGGRGEIDDPIPPHVLAEHPSCSPEERALRNVIYGSAMTEILNTARFVDTLDSMQDPFLKDVTRQLLSDEALHGQFGFLYLDEWGDWLADSPLVRASIARYLEHAFAVFERDYSGAGQKARPITEDERALGLPERDRLVETFNETVGGAIIPGLERYGIAAGEAWKKRELRG
jgi:hypothetical protein